ncbi:MAG TPA: hypothetical protein VEW65_06970 [Chryseolinea sp.]|nr:hypothetical protein [Chryseolinea sp.]
MRDDSDRLEGLGWIRFQKMNILAPSLLKYKTPLQMKIVKEEIGDVLFMLHESNITCDIQLLKRGVYWSVQHESEDAEGNSGDLLSAMTDLSESVLRLYPETKFGQWYAEKRSHFPH